MNKLVAIAAFLFAGAASAHASPTEVIGSYSVQYTPTVGNGPTITDKLASPFTEYLTVGVPTATMTFLAVTPAPRCGLCGWSNTAQGTVSVSFSFDDPTTATATGTGDYSADYWTDDDAVTWNAPDPLVVNFADGAVLDVNLVNAQDWTIYPDISFDLVQAPTPTPEPPSLALLIGGLFAAAAGLGVIRRKVWRGRARRA